MGDSLHAARLSSLAKSNQPKRENPETADRSTLSAAREGAVSREGNEDLLRRAASKYESGTPQRTAFTKARLNAEFNKNKLGKLGGKSRRRRNKKGKKKTNKRRRN